jgi:hypothetical protein
LAGEPPPAVPRERVGDPGGIINQAAGSRVEVGRRWVASLP